MAEEVEEDVVEKMEDMVEEMLIMMEEEKGEVVYMVEKVLNLVVVKGEMIEEVEEDMVEEQEKVEGKEGKEKVARVVKMARAKVEVGGGKCNEYNNLATSLTFIFLLEGKK